MKQKNIIPIIACLSSLLAVSTSTFAQVSPLEKATKAIEYKDFRAAMPLLEGILADEPTNADALAKVAQCYSVTYHLPEAAMSYEQLMPLAGVKPDDIFAYGQVLMRLGKYPEAEKRFTEFAQTNPEIGGYFAQIAKNAVETAQTSPNYTVKAAPFNSAASDFGASFYADNQLVFTSTRDPEDSKSKIGLPARLFVANLNGKGVYSDVKLEKSPINQKENEGPVSFTENGTTGVFARNNIKNGSSPLPNGGMKQDLFIGNLKGAGIWETPKAFEFNGIEYSTAYPFVTPDGKTVYFASDMPGGIGGFDLYKSENVNGKWTSPINLGEGINTTGDEITPFLAGNTLYFSSNWYEGLGGFDVFETTLDSKTPEIRSLGTAINSEGDDFGFVYSTEKNKGFISSNRKGGKGMEDIYMVVRDVAVEQVVATKEPEKVEQPEKTKERDVPKEVENPIADLVQSANSSAEALKGVSRTKAEEYSNTTPLPTAKKEITGHVLDLATNDPVEGVVVTLLNKTDKNDPELMTKTDRGGGYTLPLSPNTNYAIVYSRAGYVDDTRVVRTSDKVFLDALAYSRIRPAAFNPNAKILPKEPVSQVISAPIEKSEPKTVVPEKQAVTEMSVATKVEKTEKIEKVEKGEVFEIHILNTKTPLLPESEAALRKHGSLAKTENGGVFTYKLQYYDNIACATTTRDKVRELGYPSATVSAKEVNANENVSRMRLMLGRQKASCPSERPDEATLKQLEKEAKKDSKSTEGIKEIKEVKEVGQKEPIIYTTEPEEGEIRDPDPMAGLNNEGFLYYLQLGSFEPKRKVSFKKITALKLGELTHAPNKNGREVYMLGAFNTLAEIYDARQKVIETGEVTEPFVRTYDKDGVLVSKPESPTAEK